MNTKPTWFTISSAYMARRVRIAGRYGNIWQAFYSSKEGGYCAHRLYAKLIHRRGQWFFTWAISTLEHRLPAQGFASLQEAVDYYDRYLAIDIDHRAAREESAGQTIGGYSA
jgi:hypothetical protein